MNAPGHHDAIVQLPFATVGLRLGVGGDAIEGIEFLPPETAERAAVHPLARQAVTALRRYADEPAFRFQLPIRLHGTPFQRRVWAALQTLQCGETVRYGELAARLGSGARAIGNACRANPLPLIVPCHRVVAKHGLGGFAGDRNGGRIVIKQRLLQHEGVL